MQPVPAPNKRLIARRFARSVATYDDAALVQAGMAQQLTHVLPRVAADDTFDRVLELGCGTGLLTSLIVQRFKVQRLALNDLVPDLADRTKRRAAGLSGLRIELRPGDMETVNLPDEQDLVISNAVLQWAADPETMLGKMLGAVRPGGLLAMATFGPRNLTEVSKLTGCSLHYLSLSAMQALLAADSELLLCRERLHTLWFDSAYHVLQHLKDTGVNSLRQQIQSPRAVRAFCKRYEAEFGRGSRIPLSYHPILLIARRRRVTGQRA